MEELVRGREARRSKWREHIDFMNLRDDRKTYLGCLGWGGKMLGRREVNIVSEKEVVKAQKKIKIGKTDGLRVDLR